MTLTRGSTTLVASRRPPMPTSSTAMSDLLAGKIFEGDRQSTFQKLGCHGKSAFGRPTARRCDPPRSCDAARSRRRILRAPLIRTRSLDSYQVRRGIQSGLQSRNFAELRHSVAAVEPFPFVPAIRTRRKLSLRVARARQQHAACAPGRTCGTAFEPVHGPAQTSAKWRHRRTFKRSAIQPNSFRFGAALWPQCSSQSARPAG